LTATFRVFNCNVVCGIIPDVMQKHDGYFHLYVLRADATISYASFKDSEVI